MNTSTDFVERYRTDGFAFPLRVLETDAADRLARQVLELREVWGRPGMLDRPLDDHLRANFHVVSRLGARLARIPTVLDHVERIIGPDILCWMTEVIVKDPGSGSMLSMHQDLTYWGFGATDQQVTAWIALTDAWPDNGGMSFVRGSHLGGLLPHDDTFAADNLLSRGQTARSEHDAGDEVPVGLLAGEMSLHHGLMLHGSGPNRTSEPRIGVVVRYLSPEVVQQVATCDYALVVRGVNRTNNMLSVGEPDGDFTPAGLRLWHEIEAAQMQALARGADTALSYTRPIDTESRTQR